MSFPNRISAEAESAGARYGLLVEGWRGIYARALHDSRFGTAKLIAAISDQAYALARTYLASEKVLVEVAIYSAASEARAATSRALSVDVVNDDTVALTEHVSAAGEYLLRELSIQIERDIAFLVESVRRTYLAINLSARAQGTSTRAALMEYSIGNASQLQFSFHDRRNYRWPSRKFVRSVWRLTLLNSYNEVVMLTLADHGVDHAFIEHTDSGSSVHGMLVALYSGSQHPTYDEIRNEVFHPNSEAILRAA